MITSQPVFTTRHQTARNVKYYTVRWLRECWATGNPLKPAESVTLPAIPVNNMPNIPLRNGVSGGTRNA